MTRNLFTLLTVAIGFFPMALPATTSQDAAASAPAAAVHEIPVTASKYKFDPAEIQVKKGEKVRLVLTTTDTTHGLKIDEFNINQRIEKGKPATVEFTPDKIGTFAFKCSVFCGIGHSGMKGKLVVTE